MRRQLVVMASAIENQGKVLNIDRVVMPSICFSIFKMLEYGRIPSDSEPLMKVEELSDDDTLPPSTSAFTAINKVFEKDIAAAATPKAPTSAFTNRTRSL